MTRKGYVLAVAAMVLGACGQPRAAGPVVPRTFTAPLYDTRGTQVGTVALTERGDSTHLMVHATGVAAGTHGTHLHAVGRCDEPDFTTAGPHLNPTNSQHGMRNPRGPHLGDLPNLTVGSNREGHLEVMVAAPLRAGTPPLFDVDGTALVVHATADDQVTDPSGNSGARIACAVVAAPAARAMAGTASRGEAR